MALTLEVVADVASADTAAEASLPRARLHTLNQERIVLVSNRPAPPGAPLVLHFLGRTFEARAKSCKRNAPEGHYLLEARLVNLSKLARAELEKLMNRSRLPDSSPAKAPRDR